MSYGGQHSTAGFLEVAAIAELALSDIRMKFDETPGQVFCFDMTQAEFLKAGGVDDGAVFIEMIELRVRG